MGLRDDKKEQTRRRISDVATRLFLKRGYDAVTTAEIAQAAEVSSATLFNYFPVKEALIFDEDRALEEDLAGAITARPAGIGVLDALRQAILDGPYFRFTQDPAYAAFFDLIRATPELSTYARHMATRYERALARAILEPAPVEPQAVTAYIVGGRFTGQRNPLPDDTAAEPAPVTNVEAQAIAHYVVEALFAAQQSPEPVETFNALIDLMKQGFAR